MKSKHEHTCRYEVLFSFRVVRQLQWSVFFPLGTLLAVSRQTLPGGVTGDVGWGNMSHAYIWFLFNYSLGLEGMLVPMWTTLTDFVSLV